MYQPLLYANITHNVYTSAFSKSAFSNNHTSIGVPTAGAEDNLSISNTPRLFTNLAPDILCQLQIAIDSDSTVSA